MPKWLRLALAGSTATLAVLPVGFRTRGASMSFPAFTKGVLAASALLGALAFATPALATTYNVATTAQLTSALDAANSNAGLDTIVMALGTYVTGSDLEVMDDLIVRGDPG